MTVSDRASALIKLGGKKYLDVSSMPDLFHFLQDFGKSIGSKLGLAVRRQAIKVKEIEQANSELLIANGENTDTNAMAISAFKALEEQKNKLAKLQQSQTTYQIERENINKIVHPFDEEDHFVVESTVGKMLTQTFVRINQVVNGLTEVKIEMGVDKAQKILKQIPDLAKGIRSWQIFIEIQVKALEHNRQIFADAMAWRKWIMEVLLPFVYWQIHISKCSTRKRDKNLNDYYKQRAEQAQQRWENHTKTRCLTDEDKEFYVGWAFEQAATFQRASSQVEGRNGYLAFVHHAHKGISDRRRKVLTVVHNFDIRRKDGKTPAQRLFKKEFSNLFEFILDNVTDLPKPRKRKVSL